MTALLLTLGLPLVVVVLGLAAAKARDFVIELRYLAEVKRQAKAAFAASDAHYTEEWRREQQREARILEGEDIDMPYERGTSKERN